AHLIFAPFNVFFQKIGSPGKLSRIDFEDESAEEFGVGRIENFKQNQLIDLYACVECGRCTDVCPASGTGKMLSPMHLITKLRDHLAEKGAAVASRTPGMPACAFSGSAGNRLAEQRSEIAAASSETVSGPAEALASYEGPSLVGDVITE